MRQYLPDTNAFSDYAHGKNASLVARMDAEAASQHLILSAIVLAEMSYDWQKTGGTKRTLRQRAFATQLPPQAFNDVCAHAYGMLKYFFWQQGNANPIGERDMLIAAHALALGATLVTHNVREFSRVPGLHVEDWHAAP